VPQVVSLDSRTLLLFSCDAPALAGARADEQGGIWAVEAAAPTGPFDTAAAELVVDERLYSGRIIRDRGGMPVMLAFENATTDGEFVGTLSDPIPLEWAAAERTITLLHRTEDVA
jgi:beta-fructofuranosidase